MRRQALERDWTQGSIVSNLWALSWPLMISQTLNMIGPTVDMIWIGRLGEAAIAGVGISSMAVTVVNSLLMGLFTGLRAMISRSVGAGDNAGASHILQQAFFIGSIFSAITAIIGLLLAKQILLVFGVAPAVVADGAAYMRIQFLGMVTMSLLNITQASMQASGDAVTPMRISIVYRFMHLGLVPFFIFGWWVFPRLGVTGAALTNVITQGIGGGLGLWILLSGRTRLKLTLRHFQLDRSVLWRMLKVGVPASITGMQRSFPYLVLVWFVAPFGTAAVAAHSLSQRIDNIMRTPALAFGQSTGILAGQAMGSGQTERAARTGWYSSGVFTGIMAVACIFIWFYAEHIIRIFNSEPELVHIGATFLRIQIAGYMVSGITVVLSTGLNGMGDTWPVMMVTLISMWAIQIPLAWWLTTTFLGVYGIRWAMVIAQMARASFYPIYFKAGRWKRLTI